MLLFEEYNNQSVNLEISKSIPGLEFHYDVITRKEEIDLIKNIDCCHWLNDLNRRVQHYGYKYDYKIRSVSSDGFLGNLPKWLDQIVNVLLEQNMLNCHPNQAIINEYVESQGIAPHVDSVESFEETIVSLSLGGTCIMQFANISNKEKHQLFLEGRTLLIMRGDARYKWTHEIPKRKVDFFNGHEYKRSRRISITFRRVKNGSK